MKFQFVKFQALKLLNSTFQVTRSFWSVLLYSRTDFICKSTRFVQKKKVSRMGTFGPQMPSFGPTMLRKVLFSSVFLVQNVQIPMYRFCTEKKLELYKFCTRLSPSGGERLMGAPRLRKVRVAGHDARSPPAPRR